MTLPLVVRSAAEAEATDAALWYEARAVGLGADFLRAVDVALTEIQRMPERFPLVHRGCRRALLRRFPYAIYYVPSAEAIHVIACTHAGRHPRSWRERVGE
jgi:toxin ParE1/3/4